MAAIGKIYKGRYLEIDEYHRVVAADAPDRSHLPSPMISNDSIEVLSQTNGKMYTSKSALRAEYRRAGVTEVGNAIMSSKPREYKPEGVRDDLRKAFARHK